MGRPQTYTDKQINEFLDLAQEVGITRAKRELGYPNSWATGQNWAKQRNVSVATDELKAQAAETREWYKEEEVKTVIQEGFNRVYEALTTDATLTPDDQKKLSDAANKYYLMWVNIQGKASTITETRSSDTTMDDHLAELLAMERAKNVLKNKEDKPQGIRVNADMS
jgi:hypothetical protein